MKYYLIPSYSGDCIIDEKGQSLVWSDTLQNNLIKSFVEDYCSAAKNIYPIGIDAKKILPDVLLLIDKTGLLLKCILEKELGVSIIYYSFLSNEKLEILNPLLYRKKELNFQDRIKRYIYMQNRKIRIDYWQKLYLKIKSI